MVHHSYAEYRALEDESPTKHEFLDGEIYAMAGGTPDHAALAATVIRILGSQLHPGCRVFTSDLRVRISATGLSTYPDAAVICGRSARAEDDAMAVTNPTVIVEVTSPSAEAYDRGAKLRHFQQLSSAREILIVSHTEPRLTLHRREGGSWSTIEAVAGQTLTFESVGANMAVDDVYREALEDAPR
jgi:Uma2 family endonuclease